MKDYKLRNNERNKMKKIVSVLLGIIIPFIFFVSSITLLSQITAFYTYEFEKLNTIEKANIEEVSPNDMAEMMVEYIKGKREIFQLSAQVNHKEQNLFNNKEQQHMKDVKALIHLGNWVSGIGIGLIIILYFLLYKIDKSLLRRMYKITLGVYILFLVGLMVMSKINFNKGFNLFHEIFFTNDLWILNPNKDILLMLMPLNFFMDALILALILETIIIALLGVITWRITKTKNIFSL